MTNEVVQVMTNGAAQAASLTERFCGEFSQHVSRQQELWDQIVTWASEKGIGMAVNLLVAVIMLVAGKYVIKAVVAASERVVLRGKGESTLISRFTVSVVSKCCWAFLLVMVLERLGVDVGPLIAGLGVTGFILGFAFQESLGNLASGLMIAINQPFKPGDYVIVAGHEGSVLQVDMMATVLASADNKRIVVPNKAAWGSPITNFTAMKTRRVDLEIGIDYGNDVAKAIQVAVAALAKVPGVLSEPAPSVIVGSLGDSAVTLKVRPWTKTEEYWNVYSDAYQRVKRAFEESGVTIPFPQLDVHLDK